MILNLLGPTTTGSDVIEVDAVRLKNLNDVAMAQKKRDTDRTMSGPFLLSTT